MEDWTQPPLQKPPGYKDPNTAPAAPAGQSPYRKPAPLPPAFREKRRRCGCCRCCCCCLLFLFLFLFCVVLALLAFSAAIYFWYRPALPDFHLQFLRTKQLDVVVGPNGARVSSDITAKVQASNNNEKVELHYGPTRFRVTAEAGPNAEVVELGESTVPGFEQERGNVTVLAFDAEVKGAAVNDDIVKGLKSGVTSGKLALMTEVTTSVGITMGNIKSGRIRVLVSCGPATMKQLGNGGTPKCRIKLFDLITLS